MKLLKGLTIAILLAATTAQADMPATHGMLIFGNKVTYASHLPMFHHPHDYQVVMKVSFAVIPQDVALAYQALKDKGETLFTIAPELMDLTKVMNGTIPQFKAGLFQGHFERGGKKLGNVTVKVEKFVVNTKLDPGAPEVKDFIVFGEQSEYFAAHVINGKPSFDAILMVKQPVNVKVVSCRSEDCGTVIVPLDDAQLPVTIPYAFIDQKIPSAGQQLGFLSGNIAGVLQVIYAEENELAN